MRESHSLMLGMLSRGTGEAGHSQGTIDSGRDYTKRCRCTSGRCRATFSWRSLEILLPAAALLAAH